MNDIPHLQISLQRLILTSDLISVSASNSLTKRHALKINDTWCEGALS